LRRDWDAEKLAALQPALDGTAIHQALINLIDNAFKHSQPHSAVTLGCAPDGDGPKLRFWVEDQGEGIPPAEHEKIFLPFYRSGDELRRRTAGIGIGLAIVRHIVEQHHGTITLESIPGIRTRFTLWIPVMAAANSRENSDG
jgi:two-component system OmpR family sensor kinase